MKLFNTTVALVFLTQLWVVDLMAQPNNYEFKDNIFYLFIKQGGYSNKTSQLVANRKDVKYYRFLGNYYIDRDRKGIVNYKYVDEGLSTLYPDKDSKGFLCLDLENKYYQDVKNLPRFNNNYQRGVEALADLIKYVKKKRPNLKVGIYGLPFSYYWIYQRLKLKDKDLDQILTNVDYISPALYIVYPDEERGHNANIEYLKDNLENALEYGRKLNKPVIPYVWYLVHPTNKKNGRRLISSEQMYSYLKTIRDFKVENKKITGVIWWEPAKLDIKMQSDEANSLKGKVTKDEILIDNFRIFNEQN